MNKKDKQQLRRAIVEGIRMNADRIFDLSQRTSEGYVPVDKGFLKRSGSVERIPGGSVIRYRAPYAADVEFGIEQDRPITGEQVIYRGAHKRKGYYRKDGKYVPPGVVKAHTARLVGKRLIFVRPKYSNNEYGKGFFRVISKIKARKGQFFLTRAAKNAITQLPNDIGMALRRLGQVNVSGGH
jgi:hypothetical protein